MPTEREKLNRDYGRESEKGRIIVCSHCRGSGMCSVDCCLTQHRNKYGRGSHATCSVCGGKGKVRL